jgi:hypothetical protein
MKVNKSQLLDLSFLEASATRLSMMNPKKCAAIPAS